VRVYCGALPGVARDCKPQATQYGALIDGCLVMNRSRVRFSEAALQHLTSANTCAIKDRI